MRDRRTFLKLGLLACGFAGLRGALGQEAGGVSRLCRGFGTLVPDAKGLLDLPEGFTYEVLSRRGAMMSDGFRVPGLSDGMAAFEGENGRIILVRNHELGLSTAEWGPLEDPKSLPENVACYDRGQDGEIVMPGGTTNLVYNPLTRSVEKEFLSLFGTDRNCAGGPTPWGTWLTCEEPEDLISERGRQHGWSFEVRATAEMGVQEAVPVKGLGRYRHEAVAVDGVTGVVYLTEDRDEGLFYRFVPEVPGDLQKGGKLQALVIKGKSGADTRNWQNALLNEMEPVEVEWLDLKETDSPQDDLRQRGAKEGAAVFARGEGCWWEGGAVWFCCTNGGPEQRGQLFRVRMEGEREVLELFLQPTSDDLLTNGDNLTVAGNGDVMIAEDRVLEGPERACLRGVTPEGRVYTLARNALNASEFAGVCFSPKGDILFVNLQSPGITFAIRGPWEKRDSKLFEVK